MPTRVVSEHLPFMRRYARALTGRQSSGDAYVAAALEAILADRGAFEAAPRPSLLWPASLGFCRRY